MKKLLKLILGVMLLGLISGFIYYLTLNDRYKAHYKTKLFHTLNIVDSEWSSYNDNHGITFSSPTLVIDQLYTSMEGPGVERYFTIDDSKEELVWLTSFKTEAKDLDGNTISDDFICHSNVDFQYLEHYAKWGLEGNLYRNYPRLTSMSNGIESYKFPEGFGFPIFSNEKILLQTQVLNQNIKDTVFSLKHHLKLGYTKDKPQMKPLISRPVYMQLPFFDDYKKNPSELPHNYCIPVDKDIQEIDPRTNQKVSGFWIIPKGKKQYTYQVNHQIGIKDSLKLHMIVPHLHPFSEKLELIDKTTNTTLYTCNVANFDTKIGLKNTPHQIFPDGITLYKNHDYELVLHTNNTSEKDQDMMATLFLFFYDELMDQKIKSYREHQ